MKETKKDVVKEAVAYDYAEVIKEVLQDIFNAKPLFVDGDQFVKSLEKCNWKLERRGDGTYKLSNRDGWFEVKDEMLVTFFDSIPMVEG